MKITGIICEYNPLHLGHKRQLDHVRAAGSHIVCLMSGNYVQRGHPAIFNKMLRAEAALHCGADLVLELPVTACLSSAEGFAAEGVRILSGFCDALSFGSESANLTGLLSAANALLREDFKQFLHNALDTGVSFPAARQQALRAMGVADELLSKPNDILAVEYCKAILSQGSAMKPEPIFRNSDYHGCEIGASIPSATAVRNCIANQREWLSLVPAETQEVFHNAAVHSLRAGERAMLSRLRSMSEAEFETLPFGSEGLWRKLMHSVGKEATIEDILTAVKSKRYTHTRLCRMLMCAYLGFTEDHLKVSAPFVRVLAFNDTGRNILKKARSSGAFINIGEKTDHAFDRLEKRADDLYGLFAESQVEAPGQSGKQRVIYKP